MELVPGAAGGLANLGQVGDHSVALWGVGQQRAQGGGYVFCGEAGLQEFGDDAAAGDEVDHGDGEVAVGVEVGRVQISGG